MTQTEIGGGLELHDARRRYRRRHYSEGPGKT